MERKGPGNRDRVRGRSGKDSGERIHLNLLISSLSSLLRVIKINMGVACVWWGVGVRQQ